MVGFDGSDTSLHALAWGAGEAARTGKRLIALHVVPDISTVTAAALALAPDCYVELDTGESDALVADLADRAAAGLGIPVEFLSTRGKYVRELLRAARESEADVVVVGRPARPLWPLRGSPIRRLAIAHGAPIVVVVP